MDDRTARSRENASREQTAPGSPATDDVSRNGRSQPTANASADQRSSPGKPPLTEREREERWPLG